MGPLLFNIYADDLERQLDNNCSLRQNEDNKLNYRSNLNSNFVKLNLEVNPNGRLRFFKRRKLISNDGKIELVRTALKCFKCHKLT